MRSRLESGAEQECEHKRPLGVVRQSGYHVLHQSGHTPGHEVAVIELEWRRPGGGSDSGGFEIVRLEEREEIRSLVDLSALTVRHDRSEYGHSLLDSILHPHGRNGPATNELCNTKPYRLQLIVNNYP